jgi:hypothetical protein
MTLLHLENSGNSKCYKAAIIKKGNGLILGSKLNSKRSKVTPLLHINNQLKLPTHAIRD